MRLLNKNKLERNIEEIAKYDLENNNLFGASYLVWQNESIALKKHYGSVSISGKEKVNDDTIYRMASMTKPITAIAILILVNRGLVALDDPVSKFLPEIEDIHIITVNGENLGRPKTPMTLLHCLTHTSGFGSLKNIDMSTEDMASIYNTIKCVVNTGLDFEPFTKQAYSGVAAFDLLAAVIEKVTKQEFENFLREEIFIPCNMVDTTFSPTENQWERIIMMHDKVGQKNEVGKTYPNCVFEQYPYSHKLGGAGLVSTLSDYSNFAKMLLDNGKFNNRRILPKEIIKKMSTPFVPKTLMNKYESWGLGVRVITDAEYENLPVGSFGWSGAYGTHFWVDPENNMFAVFLKNSRFDGGAENQSAIRFEEAVHRSFV